MRHTISTEMRETRSSTAAADCKSIALDLSTVKTSSEAPPRTRPRIFGLQEAPTYYPTKEEFNDDPIQYIQKIRAEAEEYGIIKIVPPEDYKPGFALDTETFRFRTRLQKLNSMEGETRANVNYLEQLYNFHRLNGHPVNKVPQLDRRPIDLFKLKKEVAQRGGYNLVTQQKKWAEVGRLLGYSRQQCTSMSNALKSAYNKLILPYEEWLSKHKEEASRRESSTQPSSKENETTTTASPPTLSPSTSSQSSNSGSSNSQQEGCEICHTIEEEDEMLLCDGCDRGYHMHCLNPPLKNVPKADWYCVKCLTAAGEDYGFEDGDEYTLREFQKVCDKFKREWFANKNGQQQQQQQQHNQQQQQQQPPATEEECENEFWRLVENPHETCQVEYGADLHSTQHGSAFAPLEPSTGAYQRWNLNMIPVLPTSLFSHIKTDISGMMVPWLYIGMCFSAFCWHNEDHYTYSINYMHWGETKTWYGVPGADTEQFENTMKAAVPELFEQQPDLLFQLTTMFSPGRLLKEGVRVYAVDQRPGQFVVTFPKAYHSGFNHGFNFCEAVNFAPWEWINYGLECAKRYKQHKRQPCFSHDELLVTTARMDHSLEAAMWLKAPLYEMQERELEARQRLLKRYPHIQTANSKEDVPEEQQQCFLCHEYTYLSRVTCECNPTRVSCLEHAQLLCRCDMSKKTLHMRFSEAELEEIVRPVLQRAYQPCDWSDKLQEFMRTHPEPSLHRLSELLSESQKIAVPPPEATWLRGYITKATKWIEEANKCQQRCISISKARKRKPATGENYQRIGQLIDELKTMAFSSPEVQSLRETYRILSEYKEAAIRVLQNPHSSADSLKGIYDTGIKLGADMEEFGRIERMVQQSTWYKEAREINQDSSPDYDKLVKLVHEAESCDIPNDDPVYVTLVKNRDQGAKWVERAENMVRHRGLRVTADSIRDLVQDSQNVPRVPNLYKAVNGLAEQAFETMKQVDRAFERAHAAKDVIGRPSVDKVRGLLNKISALPIEMQSGQKLEREVKRVDEWCKQVRDIFKPVRNNQSIEELMNEIDSSALTITKAALTERTGVYCLCRMQESGRMAACDMCHEWYHVACLRLPSRKTAPDASFICPICDPTQPIYHLTKERPTLDQLVDLAADAESLMFCPREVKCISRTSTRLLAYRDYLQSFCRSKVHLDITDLPKIRQHMRELEGLEIVLSDERDFLRQKIQELAPYITEHRTKQLVSGPIVEPAHCQICDVIENDHALMIGCDTCFGWFHLSCVQQAQCNSDASPNSDQYICVACNAKHKRPVSIKLRVNPPPPGSISPPQTLPSTSTTTTPSASTTPSPTTRSSRRRKQPDSSLSPVDGPIRKQYKA